MQETILAKLREIEEREGVRILHCVESGSRAWGFASPDSDYDVRFIYVRPREFYLRLDKTRDVIEWQLDDTLDINGWDLKKALILLRKSNSTLFEWNASPIVYRTTDEWQAISPVIQRYFEAKPGLYHYLHTAKCNYREYLKRDTVRYKKYFYVLRPLLACRWILKEGTPPPMLFSTLADCCLDDSIRPDVERLLNLKRNTPELGEGAPLESLNRYLELALEKMAAEIETVPAREDGTWEELNQLFLRVIG